MLKKVRKAAVGIIMATMLLGSSLTVFAGSCPSGGDHVMYNWQRVYDHREVVSRHQHVEITVDGEVNWYDCISYRYYYRVTQKCSKCGNTMTLSQLQADDSLVHERQ